ncbi:MAG: NAD-dependent deacylase [Polyangiales bacterium]
METPRIDFGDDGFLLVLTGAGVSAESGIPTFRDADGLWENHRVEDVASPEGFARDPSLVWRFYSLRREAASKCSPNPGHRALAALEERMGDRMLLVTQNVDGLHQRAGSERVVEIHGSLFLTRCADCDRASFHDTSSHHDAPPSCDACGEGRLRPDIVWFGEALDRRALRRIEAFVERAGKNLVYLAAGTSGMVYPAAGLVHVAQQVGADTWLVNADSPQNRGEFKHFVQGRSGEVLPSLLGVEAELSAADARA